MIFYHAKKHCRCCGKELEKRRVQEPLKGRYVNIFGAQFYLVHTRVGWTFYDDDDAYIYVDEYYCKNCDKAFSFKETYLITTFQKKLNKTVIPEDEFLLFKEKHIEKLTQSIKKLKWLSFIPCLGGIILSWKTFMYPLSEKSKSRDSYNIGIASLVSMIVFLLISKILFNFILVDAVSPNIAYALKNILPWFVSLWAFNIPVLWYINHKL